MRTAATGSLNGIRLMFSASETPVSANRPVSGRTMKTVASATATISQDKPASTPDMT